MFILNDSAYRWFFPPIVPYCSLSLSVNRALPIVEVNGFKTFIWIIGDSNAFDAQWLYGQSMEAHRKSFVTDRKTKRYIYLL